MCGNVEIVAEKKGTLAAALDKHLGGVNVDFMAVVHTFKDGVYTRSGKIAKGEVIIGAKHRAKNIFHLSKGKILVFDNVNGLRTLTAPHSEISTPGIQRVGLALEDCEGCNIFETLATTPDAVEAEMLFPFTLPVNCGEKILRLCDANSSQQI